MQYLDYLHSVLHVAFWICHDFHRESELRGRKAHVQHMWYIVRASRFMFQASPTRFVHDRVNKFHHDSITCTAPRFHLLYGCSRSQWSISVLTLILPFSAEYETADPSWLGWKTLSIFLPWVHYELVWFLWWRVWFLEWSQALPFLWPRVSPPALYEEDPRRRTILQTTDLLQLRLL